MPDSGAVFISKDIKLGYMEQHTCREATRTLFDEVKSVFAPVMAVEEQLAAVKETATKVPVFFSSNMSLGVAVLSALTKKAAAVLGDSVKVATVPAGYADDDLPAA